MVIVSRALQAVPIAALLVCAAASSSTQRKDSMPPGFTTYRNARFAYKVVCPASLRAGPEAENGDGRSFVSADGKIEVLVYGSNHLDGRSARQRYRTRLRELLDRGIAPALYACKGDWFALSWIEGGRVKYEKVFVGTEDTLHLTATYPKTRKQAMDPVLTTVVRSFARLRR